VNTLVLFDIDGTLVQGGPAKDAFHSAMEATYGTRGAVDQVSFSGKTDPQIARELLLGVGRSHAEVNAGLPQLWDLYLAGLGRRLPDLPMEILPGVVELLDVLDGLVEIGRGLVTGNILDGARLKLGSADLHRRFPINGELVGAFGCDSEHRDDLPGIAMMRAEKVWGRRFAPERVVIVGDTPRDVACGQFAGTRTLAVATGRFEVDALQSAGADLVLEDLSDTDRVVEWILE
jgi:phosphoglycolate phosphatase